MQISVSPMYGPTSPDAMVETINLGKPTGKARIRVVDSAVPQEPPIPRTAWIRFSWKRVWMTVMAWGARVVM